MLSIRAKCLCGDLLDDVILEGMGLSQSTNCAVNIEFNGTDIIIYFNDTAKKVKNRYFDNTAQNKRIKRK